MRCSFKINPYRSIEIITDNDQVPTIAQVQDVVSSHKLYPTLIPSEQEMEIIVGLTKAFVSTTEFHLGLSLPTYEDFVHVVDINFIEEKTGEANRGHYFNGNAYIARQNNLGEFASTVSHEITHLFSKEKLIWKIENRQLTIDSHFGGLSLFRNWILLYNGLDEAVTEMFSKYTTDYAIDGNFINLNDEEIGGSRLLSHAQGVHIIDSLLDRRAGNDEDKRMEYVNDLFKAYLLGDLESALQILDVSKSERKILRSMEATKESFTLATKLLGLNKSILKGDI